MDAYELLKTGLAVSNKRAELSATNIANVNTDGYKAKQVQFESNLKQALTNDDLALTKTDSRHLPVKQKLATQVTQAQSSLKENGNNVDLDLEMTNQAINGLYYNAVTAQLNGRLKMMNTILRS